MIYSPEDCDKDFSLDDNWLVPKVELQGQPHDTNISNEDAVLDLIYQEDPLDISNNFIYRGQLSRRGRCWPPNGGHSIGERHLAKYELLLERIVPSDYRDLEPLIASGHSSPGDNDVFETLPAQVRQAVTYLKLCSLKNSLGNSDVDLWMQQFHDMSDGDRYTKIGSIAQHYDFLTAYVDWTSSAQVALWFATHNWTGDYHVPGMGRVIYRIDLAILTDVENNLNTQAGHSGNTRFRHTDIRDIPSALAHRPKAQEGWSIVNMETPSFLMELIHQNAIVAFEFDNPNLSERNVHTRQTLAPVDTLSQLLSETVFPGVSVSKLTQWVDENINADLPSALHIDLTNPLWLPEFIEQYPC